MVHYLLKKLLNTPAHTLATFSHVTLTFE